MQPNSQTAYVLADNEAPIDIKTLKNKAFCAIMELTEDEKVMVLSKYAERYGVCIA